MIMPDRQPKPPSTDADFYVENGLYVYTAVFHLKRGHCCGSGCRHCPFSPPHVEGNTQLPQATQRPGVD